MVGFDALSDCGAGGVEAKTVNLRDHASAMRARASLDECLLLGLVY